MTFDSKIEKTDQTCGVMVGAAYRNPCILEAGHGGDVHADKIYDTVFHYSREDPSRAVYGYCETCHELITDENRAEGPCSAGFCREHIGPPLEKWRARNACPKCGFDGPHEMRNYNMMWHDGDIHCGRCGAYVRMYDAG